MIYLESALNFLKKVNTTKNNFYKMRSSVWWSIPWNDSNKSSIEWDPQKNTKHGLYIKTLGALCSLSYTTKKIILYQIYNIFAEL